MVQLHDFEIIFAPIRSIRREFRVTAGYLRVGEKTVIRFYDFYDLFHTVREREF